MCQEKLEKITGVRGKKKSEVGKEELAVIEMKVRELKHYIETSLFHSFEMRLPTDKIEARFEK